MDDLAAMFGGYGGLSCSIDGVAGSCSMAAGLLEGDAAYVPGFSGEFGTTETGKFNNALMDFLFGPGGPGGARYDVNLKVLNNCLADLKIPVTINAFTPSTPGGMGSATGIGTDMFSFKGINSTITVKNDAHTYNATQVGALCGKPSALGCTLPDNPYQ